MMSPRLVVSLFGLSILAQGACGDDGGGMQDPDADQPVADAEPVDAGAPDAFDPCPGATTFEAGMTDWITGDNLPSVTIKQSGTDNQVSSAPNGRAVLCVTGEGEFTVEISHPDYLSRFHVSSTELSQAQYDSGVPFIFALLKEADLDTLYTSASATRDTAAATVILNARDAASFQARSGVTATLGSLNAGSFIVGASTDSLVVDTQSGADGRLIFLNVETGKGETTSTVTAAGCQGAPELPIDSSPIASGVYYCD